MKFFVALITNVVSVYHVLLDLHKRMPLGSFFRLLEEGGNTLIPAIKLLEVYAREQNREMLRDFHYSDDWRVESAVFSWTRLLGCRWVIVYNY